MVQVLEMSPGYKTEDLKTQKETKNMFKLFTILVVVLNMSQSYGRATYWDRMMHLVTSISPTMVVEEGDSVEMECRLENIPDRAEVAWVRIWGVREVEYLSVFGKNDGVHLSGIGGKYFLTTSIKRAISITNIGVNSEEHFL